MHEATLMALRARNRRLRWGLIALSVLVVISIVAGLASGSVAASWREIGAAILGDHRSPVYDVIWQLRWPRVSAAFAVGGLLALAGALMQVLLRNPLAEPYILGISGGAAVGAISALLIGMSSVSLPAFAGALISTALVFGIANPGRRSDPIKLLLTGVVIAAGWGAVIAFMLSVSPEMQLRGILFWLLGDLSHAADPLLAWITLLLGASIAIGMAPGLDLLARGNQRAAAMGLSVNGIGIVIYLLASLFTAIAVSLAGTIGFVGLIVPHMTRLIGGTHHRWVIPASLLVGGSLLVVADTLSRTLIAPQQLPVGVLTALIGVPLFLWLLTRQK